jgi:hypothetical protein
MIERFRLLIESCKILPLTADPKPILLMENVEIKIHCRNRSRREHDAKYIYILEPYHLDVAEIRVELHTISSPEPSDE